MADWKLFTPKEETAMNQKKNEDVVALILLIFEAMYDGRNVMTATMTASSNFIQLSLGCVDSGFQAAIQVEDTPKMPPLAAGYDFRFRFWLP
jgi:hypothetical protein